MSTKFFHAKELSPLGEDVSSLQSMFPVNREWGESSYLNDLFKRRMFGNLHAQDDLYHHCGVTAYYQSIYSIYKYEKRIICI